MNDFKYLTIAESDGVAILTFNRPDALNALNSELLAEFEIALDEFAGNDEIGALILTGAGQKAFVAGADIRELSQLDAASGRRLSRRGQELFARLETLSRPVIAAVNGFCLGGGCELTLACHLRLASKNARFGQPEVKLGILPGYGGTQRLPRLVGKGKALELILTGEIIDAQEALRIGLINAVVESQQLIPEAKKLASKIISNGPLAVRYSIEAVNAGLNMPLDAGLELEASYFGLCCATRDMREGTRAFLEKREANFKGE